MTRLPDPGFDPRIADWLEADPDQAPRSVLATVLAAYPSIPQRRAWRVPRRFPTMTRFALLGAAAATLLAVMVGGLLIASGTPRAVVGTPTPPPARSPAASPAPSPALSPAFQLSQAFTSPIYGYTIGVGPGWAVVPATLPADDPAAGDNGADQIKPAGTDTTVTVDVGSLGGQTFDRYKTDLAQAVANDTAIPASCRPSDPSRWAEIPVGDKTGLRVVKCNFEQVIVDAGDRVYTFTWGHDTFENARHLLLGHFQDMLATVTFPASPPPLPSPGPRAVPEDFADTFISRVYPYRIGTRPVWTNVPATVEADQPGSGEDGVDRIEVTATDTTILVHANALNGKPFDTWLADQHEAVLADTTVPARCKAAAPDAWPPIVVGSATGRLMTLCNDAEAFVQSGDLAFTFEWTHDTFDEPAHLSMTDFATMLSTVTFEAGASPKP